MGTGLWSPSPSQQSSRSLQGTPVNVLRASHFSKRERIRIGWKLAELTFDSPQGWKFVPWSHGLGTETGARPADNCKCCPRDGEAAAYAYALNFLSPHRVAPSSGNREKSCSLRIPVPGTLSCLTKMRSLNLGLQNSCSENNHSRLLRTPFCPLRYSRIGDSCLFVNGNGAAIVI